MILTKKEFKVLYDFLTMMHLHDGVIFVSKENFENISDTIAAQSTTISQLQAQVERYAELLGKALCYVNDAGIGIVDEIEQALEAIEKPE